MRFWIAGSLLGAFAVGCGAPAPMPQTPVTTPMQESTTDAPILGASLDHWRRGDHEQATTVFLSINDWSSSNLTRDDATISLSESEFTTASQPRQAELSEELVKNSRTIRELVRHVVDAAKQEPDTDKATAMLQQIDALGHWLNSSDRTLLVQKLGQALCATAAEELQQLETE